MSDPARIRLLVLDVDGVLTDGSITYDDAGRETKSFFVRDGLAIKLWIRQGLSCAFLTGRGGAAVERRAAELGVEQVRQGSTDKAADLRAITASLGVELAETAYMGDDWPDLPAMRICGYPMCPADAHPDAAEGAAFQARSGGGRGAVREAIEHLLGARGTLRELREQYHTDHGT